MPVKDDVSQIPIVVFKDALPYTRQAADELATYIEKISGAKPDVIDGDPRHLFDEQLRYQTEAGPLDFLYRPARLSRPA